MKRLLIALTLAAQITSMSAVPWVSRHDMTAAEYQTEFNKYTAAPYHYRLTSVAGYNEGNGARYAAVWESRPGPGWITHAGLSSTQVRTLSASYSEQGFRPVFVSGFASGSAGYHNVIWEYQPSATVSVESGMTLPIYIRLNSSRLTQGYKLVHLYTYSVGSTDYFDAIWKKNETATYHVQYRRSGSEYQSDFNALTAQGYQLMTVSAATHSSQPLYTSVWKLPGTGTAWYSTHNLTKRNYQGETSNWYYQGYRPAFASAFVFNGETRFNGIWHRNGGMSPSNLSTIDTTINRYMQTNNIPGLSLAISRQGRLVYAKGFGLADQVANERVDPNHRFRIASVSKPITGAAAVLLQEHCSLNLDDTVFGPNAILGETFGTPPYSARERAITVRNLLHHTSGWGTDGIWQVTTTNPNDAINWQLDNTEPNFMPGINYNYMNVGYATVGRVIETVSGKSYEQFVQDELLTPSCITDMEIGGNSLAERKPREVVYYDTNPYSLSPTRMDAHGGWIARPIDLLLLLRRMDGNTNHADLLSSDALTQMLTDSAATNSNNYGLGAGLGAGGATGWSGTPNWGHNGSMNGSMAWMIYRSDGLGFALTINTRSADGPWPIGGIVDSLVSTLDAANAWPSYDLFPCSIPAGDSPTQLAHSRTFYVDGGSRCQQATGSQNCSANSGPFQMVNQAVAAACSSDTIYIRAGNYNERVTFSLPATIHSYDGTAIIGE